MRHAAADAVVIGSGALGAATAFWLAKRGLDVVLVDRFDLVSQTSPRAAGLAQKVQVDDVLAELAIRGVDALLGFERAHRRPLDVVVNGSVKIARTSTDAEQLRGGDPPRRRARRRDRRGRRRRGRAPIAPWLQRATAPSLISYAPDRRLHRGAGRRSRARSCARCRISAERRCANTEVTGFVLDDGSRPRRRDLRAAGSRRRSWSTPPARGRASSAGSPATKIPLFPARHQLCITEPLSEVVADASDRARDGRARLRAALPRRPDVRRLRARSADGRPGERGAPGFQVADLEFDMRAAAAQDGRGRRASFRCSAMRRSPSCAAGCRR